MTRNAPIRTLPSIRIGDRVAIDGGDVRAESWEAAERACPPGTAVIGELVAAVTVGSANVHPEPEMVQ